MKPYGIPRLNLLIYPDIADIHHFGLKSSIGSIEKYGNIRGIHKNKNTKRITRRLWKKRARAKNKKEINLEILKYLIK